MNSHVSLQPDPKSQPPMDLNHTLLLIKARITYQSKFQQRKVSSLFQSSRGNRNTMSTHFSLSPQTSGGRNVHVKYVDLNSTPQSDSRSQRTTHREFSTLLPPIKTLKSMHEEFSTPFPPDTKSSYATNGRFSTPGTSVNRRHVGFSRINLGRYTPISSPIAGLGSDSSPPEVSMAA